MLSEDQFTAWLSTLGVPPKPGELAARTGESTGKLRAQLLRSRVPWSTVVAISRSVGRNPVEELATFPVFADLRRTNPLQREALSQVQVEDVLLEIAKRRRSLIAKIVGSAGYALQPFPFEDSTRYWLDAIDDDGTLRTRLIQTTTLDKAALSRAVSTNRLSPEQAVTAAAIAGGTPSVGLVLIGLVSAEEAGWSPTSRDTALFECSDADLVDLADARLKTLRRRLKADAAETNYWKTLG
jgi:hypothetical protein